MIFIAAGKGSRLSNITNGNHKALVKINNKSLIDILFQNCLEIGINEVIVVTGFKKHLITEHTKALKTNINIELIHNLDWKLPNGLSVLTAKDLIPKGDDFLLSMCDHYYFPSLLDLVKKSNLKNTLVNVGIDYNLERIFDIDDAMKVNINKNNNLIKSMAKTLTTYNAVDCGVFKCNYDFFSILETAKENDKYSLSDACNLLIKNKKLGGINICDNFWIDIDTPDSLNQCNIYLKNSNLF